jgi:glutamyl/glutaminyl-tRNA synthetase
MQRWGMEASRDWIDTFIDAYGEELQTIEQARPLVAALRTDAVALPALELERLRKPETVSYLRAVGAYVDGKQELRGLPVSRDLPALAEQFGLPKKDAFHCVRIALTGEERGAPLALLFPLLGRDRVKARLGAVGNHEGKA